MTSTPGELSLHLFLPCMRYNIYNLTWEVYRFSQFLIKVGDTRFFEEIPESYVTRGGTKMDTFVCGNTEDKDYYLY
jgi:hypothetical protein